MKSCIRYKEMEAVTKEDDNEIERLYLTMA